MNEEIIRPQCKGLFFIVYFRITQLDLKIFCFRQFLRFQSISWIECLDFHKHFPNRVIKHRFDSRL